MTLTIEVPSLEALAEYIDSLADGKLVQAEGARKKGDQIVLRAEARTYREAADIVRSTTIREGGTVATVHINMAKGLVE